MHSVLALKLGVTITLLILLEAREQLLELSWFSCLPAFFNILTVYLKRFAHIVWDLFKCVHGDVFCIDLGAHRWIRFIRLCMSLNYHRQRIHQKSVLTHKRTVKHEHNHVQNLGAPVYTTSATKAEELPLGRDPVREESPWVVLALPDQTERHHAPPGREKNIN
jgi:hypothetical protein